MNINLDSSVCVCKKTVMMHKLLINDEVVTILQSFIDSDLEFDRDMEIIEGEDIIENLLPEEYDEFEKFLESI